MPTDLIEQRDALRAEVESLRLKDEVAALQESLRIREQFASIAADIPEAWGEPVPKTDYPDRDMPGWSWGRGEMAALEDRDDGKFLPVYETEQDLLRLFALGRGLGSGTSVGVGAIDRLYEFTFGDGFEFEVAAEKGAGPSAGLVTEAQAVLDRFLDRNHVAGGLDRDLHRRTREDGEQLVALSVAGGHVLARLYEADQLREPREAARLTEWLRTEHGVTGEVSWSFGVATPRYRSDLPYGYHVVHDSGGVHWEFVPADEAVHVRRNVTARAKRGVSDFYAISRDVLKDDKLTAALGTAGVAIARIVGVRKHAAGTTKSDVTALLGDTAVGSIPRLNRTPPGGTRSVPAIPYEGGSVIDAGQYDWVNGPLGATNGPNLVLIAQHLRRSIGVRWGMPEFLISGDASNANYASTAISAEAWTRARKADQQFYGAALESLLWKVLRLAHRAGLFGAGLPWEEVEVALVINTVAPDVQTPDPVQRAQRQAVEIQAGTLSRRTAASEAGRDFDAEVANRERDGDAPVVAPVPPPAKPEGNRDSAARGADGKAIATALANQDVQVATDLVLNGAQITAATGIVAQVAAGEIPRDAGLGQLRILFNLTDAQAAAIMGSAGTGRPTTPNPKPAAPGAVAGALQGALESVQTTDEARAIIESMRRKYP